jgi:hypothetical protein
MLVPAQRIQPAARRFQAGVLRPLGHGGHSAPPEKLPPRSAIRCRATNCKDACDGPIAQVPTPGNLAAVDDAAASGGGDCLCHVPICYAAVGRWRPGPRSTLLPQPPPRTRPPDAHDAGLEESPPQ